MNKPLVTAVIALAALMTAASIRAAEIKVLAAKALIKFLTTAAAGAVFKAKGQEPG